MSVWLNALGSDCDAAHELIHISLGVPACARKNVLAQIATNQFGTGAQRRASRLCPASSFYITDLTNIDPRATCQHDLKACAVRNAICESEITSKDQKKPSYHCVCRPGSAAVPSGVCVPKQCTNDVAKAVVATQAARKHVEDAQAKELIHAADADQEKHDGREEKLWTEKGVEWWNGLSEEESWPKKTWGSMNEKDKEITSKDEKDIAKIDEDAAFSFGLNKGLEGLPIWNLKHPPPKKWTAEGQKWFDELRVEPGSTWNALKLEKEVKAGSPIDKNLLEKIEEDPSAKRQFQDSIEEEKPFYTESTDAEKNEYQDAIRKRLSARQKNFNVMFAGRMGIMPGVPIPGGSPSLNKKPPGPDFKIKLVLPDKSKIRVAGGEIEVGSEKLPPALIDDMSKVVNHLARAEQLKTAIKWNDVRVVHPSGGASGPTTGDAKPDPALAEVEAARIKSDEKKDAKVEAALMAAEDNPGGMGMLGMPGAALIAAGFTPGWVHRSRASSCRVQPVGARNIIAQTRCAQWAAFLSPAEQALRTRVISPSA